MSHSDALNLALPVYCHGRVSPERLALTVDERSYTYGQLSEAACRLAHWIRANAQRTDNREIRVGILCHRSFETYAGILGAAWAGGTYVPLNPKQPSARLKSILVRAKLDVLIVDKKGLPHLPEFEGSLPSVMLMPDQWDSLPASSDAPAAVSADHPAYIMFTSGTTGVPKGVVVTAGNVAHFLAVSRSLYHITPSDRLGQFCETSFDVSVFEIFAAWDAAASLHVVPEGQCMAPGGFIRKHELTIWTSVPSVILAMTKLKQLQPGAFPTLRFSYFIGEALPSAAAKAWQAAAPNSIVDNEYGPTEATVACLVYRPSAGALHETPGRGTVAIGHPYPGMQAGIVTDGKFLPVGEVGELVLHGAQVAAGYLDDPKLTAERFPTLNHPALGPSRWYLTGDYAFLDEQGFFHCLGRIDNQVKVMGHRIELEDVEAHLRAVCGTDSVAAVAWPIVDGHPTGIVGFVSGSPMTTPVMRDELKKRVPAYMVPAKVVAVDSLPLNSNGKVDRKALRSTLEAKV